MIGNLAGKVFMMSAKASINKLSKNPKLHNAVEKYHRDSHAFKKQLKDMGILDSEDLVKAVNANPNIKNKAETSKQAFARIDKELGDLSL